MLKKYEFTVVIDHFESESNKINDFFPDTNRFCWTGENFNFENEMYLLASY